MSEQRRERRSRRALSSTLRDKTWLLAPLIISVMGCAPADQPTTSAQDTEIAIDRDLANAEGLVRGDDGRDDEGRIVIAGEPMPGPGADPRQAMASDGEDREAPKESERLPAPEEPRPDRY